MRQWTHGPGGWGGPTTDHGWPPWWPPSPPPPPSAGPPSPPPHGWSPHAICARQSDIDRVEASHRGLAEKVEQLEGRLKALSDTRWWHAARSWPWLKLMLGGAAVLEWVRGMIKTGDPLTATADLLRGLARLLGG